MTDAASVSYKVYLEDGSGINEIRRFGVERNLAFKFNFLREKLQKVFPLLQSKNFDVYWKDLEGDSVIISSDEELAVALGEMNVDVRKLYIVVKSDENFAPDMEMNDTSRPTDGPLVHEGVTCDGCNKKPITGFRYKCAACPDFDLCSTCEGYGMHDEHFMIRISKPIKWRSTYSRRLAHQMAKWYRQGDAHRHHHHQRRGSNVKGASGQQSSENPGQCPYYRGMYRAHPGWLEYLCNQLSEWVNLPGETEMGSGPGDTTARGPGDTAASRENAAAPEKAAHPASSASTENVMGPQVTGPSGKANQLRETNYLQTVAETVAALLDPLGIDVEIHMKEKNQNETDEKQKQSEGTEKTQEVASPEPMDVTQEAPSAPPEQESSEAEGWTVVPENTASGSSNAEEKTPEEMLEDLLNSPEVALVQKLYPTMKDVNDRTRELELEQGRITDPKVAETLRKLLAMGFTNEGAWLTQLIIIKDGDIDRVLDVLLEKD